MKVKLLKKIRKRFDYKIINKNKMFDKYVLIDNKLKKVTYHYDLTDLCDSLFYIYIGFFTTLKRRREINQIKKYNTHKL